MELTVLFGCSESTGQNDNKDAETSVDTEAAAPFDADTRKLNVLQQLNSLLHSSVRCIGSEGRLAHEQVGIRE